jgi:hypothetical protein
MTYKIAFSTMALDHKIPPGDALWSEFNASFTNKDLDLIDIANEIYCGHPFTTWHKNNWRNAANYQLGQHIGIDFDTEDQHSSLTFLAKDKFIQKYAALIYTTPSHKPEAPRSRVLFLLDTPIQQAKNYTSAVSALLWLFGTADRQCKDSCRFFYGSHNCEVEWIDQVLPLDKIKQIIGQYQATGNVAKESHIKHYNYIAPADQQEVSDALKVIRPWSVDYDDWLKILMAIHHAFGDAGLSLAESWAEGVDGEVKRKWRSFKANGNGTGAVTLNTVFKLARDNGWKMAA